MNKFLLYAMSALYIIAGVNHFVHPDSYMQIMPTWLPWHFELVILSGIFEIALALFLLFERTQKTAAWCIILLLIAIFPANIQMMLNYYHESNPLLWLAIVRLPLQILLIWWAHYYTK